MRRQGWLWVLLMIAFTATVLLAVAKVRSPEVKFDRIAVGMSKQEVFSILGNRDDVWSYRDGASLREHAHYDVGPYAISVYLVDGQVTEKSLRFDLSLIWWPEERGQTFAF